MANISFLLEQFLRTDYPPEGAIAADDIDRIYNVYKLGLLKPAGYATSYWVTAFGGNYDDLPDIENVQIIMDQFLQRVDTQAAMENTENSYWVNNGEAYMNLPKKPWQYKSTNTEVLEALGISYGAKNPNNPSDVMFAGENYPSRLRLPSVNSKLSDSVSGISLFQEWGYTADNDDGFYDDQVTYNFFNTPQRLLKAFQEDKTELEYSDYKVIRTGLVNNQKTDFDKLSITVSDIWRSLDQDVTRKYNSTDFPSAGSAVWGKDIARLWGALPDTPLVKISSTTFYAGDGITAVSAVYDSDGGSLSYSFSASTGIITEATGEAKTADVTGNDTTNTIGQMIVDMLEEKANIFYNESSWDTTEADTYRLNSPEVNMHFDKGTVREFVKQLLASDDAFLIQKNEGLLTLRKWGTTYTTHTIPSWRISKRPARNYDDAKDRFLSAIQINYNKNISSGTFNDTYFDDDSEDGIFEEWRRKRLQSIDVLLANSADVEALGDSRISRFGGYKETVKVGLGYDTSEIELLDTVYLNITINARIFSSPVIWTVKEVNSAQDEIVIEETVGALVKGIANGDIKMLANDDVKAIGG